MPTPEQEIWEHIGWCDGERVSAEEADGEGLVAVLYGVDAGGGGGAAGAVAGGGAELRALGGTAGNVGVGG